ncbi:MAG: hypothetical protein ABIP74_05325 [Candidatus Saccharimonas sp.]
MDILPTTSKNSKEAAPELKLTLPDIGRTQLTDEFAEPTTDEILLADHAGIDPWFFDGDNVLTAFNRLSLVDKKKLSSITGFLDGIEIIGDLVRKETEGQLSIADSLQPAEVALLDKAKTALTTMSTEGYEPSHFSLSPMQRLRALGSAAITSGSTGALLFALPQWAQFGMYGVAAGGAALSVPVLKELIHEGREITKSATRGEECVAIITGIEKKLAEDGAMLTVPNIDIELDLDKIKRSSEPEYVALRHVAVDHAKSVELPTKNFGEVVLATLFSGGFRALKQRTLDINPADATTRLIDRVQETNPEYLSALWRGNKKGNGIKPILEELATAQTKLQQQIERQEKILSIDNDVEGEAKDDVQTVKHLGQLRGEAQKRVDIAVLRLVKLRQDTMRYLGQHEAHEVSTFTWPLLEK